MTSSTLRIISAASEALSSTWRFTWKDSVMPSSAMSPMVPSDMSEGDKTHGAAQRALPAALLWTRVVALPHSLSPAVLLFSWCAALSWATRSALS